MKPDPAQLLRVSVGFGFRRARLNYAYLILRGKDLETEQFSDERREQQFAKLKIAQEKVLDLQNWHEFLKAIRHAGYVSGQMISRSRAGCGFEIDKCPVCQTAGSLVGHRGTSVNRATGNRSTGFP